MNTPCYAEIRQIQTYEDPLFACAKRLNDTTHAYLLDWLDLPHQSYVALDPDTPEKVIGVIQVEDFSIARHHKYGDAYISRLAVDSGFRRMGVGSLLVAHTVQIAREAGLELMSTIALSPTAQAFFEKQGFLRMSHLGRKGFTRYHEL